MTQTVSHHFDVLIIGTGAAGLGLALSLASDKKIALISKDNFTESSSKWAQGGIAAVIDQASDSYQSHIADTLRAGAGLCHTKTVEFVVQHAKEALEWLIAEGVQFTLNNDGQYHLTQEGGHSYRRIFHAKDRTGSEVVQTLAEQVVSHDNITIFDEHTAIDLLVQDERCYGALVLNNATGENMHFIAKCTALATGGASFCYQHTTNPDHTSGDGIAMAFRAGCRVANLEFNQFHPTSLFHPEAKSFLISEAVRGEGGILLNKRGERFMPSYDSRAELAPRDIVARAIDQELKKHQDDCVYLDISFMADDEIKNLFPTIYERCLGFGIDICRQAIPVVPAAHYTCGGVMTDLHGQTDIKQLYAIGEVACTGLHGANRMASNSLLECLVFAMSSAKSIKYHFDDCFVPARDEQRNFQGGTICKQSSSDLITTIQQLLWQHAGIVRQTTSLHHAKNSLAQLKAPFPIQSKQDIEARNMLCVAKLIVECALMRKESRGLHFVLDYPQLLAKAADSVIANNH